MENSEITPKLHEQIMDKVLTEHPYQNLGQLESDLKAEIESRGFNFDQYMATVHQFPLPDDDEE